MPVDHSNTSIEKDLVKSIDNAILRRIEGHTNVALSLSGGFDSSLIAYRLKKLDIPFTAFTAFWRDSDKDRYNEDARVAEEFCKKIGVPLERIEMPATAEIPNLFVEVQRICGEPISNPTSISMVRLYRDIARSGYRLVLTGDGSDEIFGGYQRHVNTRKFKNLLNVGSYATDFLASGAFPSIPRNLRLLLSSQLSQPKLSLDLFWHEIFSLSDISQLLSLPKIHVYKSIRMSIIENLKNFKGNKNNVSAIMNFDRAIWLSMESNRKLDRISMHNSIEARSPFQDDLLILLAGRLMEDSNYRNLNKDLLRKQFKQLHALGVRDDKAGFTSPLGHWIRKNQDFFQVYVEKAEVALEIPKRLRMSIDFAKLVQKREYRINQKIWTLATLGIFLDEPRLEIEKSY
jgi:asparagine synthase (glutamine-hydrolysing)